MKAHWADVQQSFSSPNLSCSTCNENTELSDSTWFLILFFKIKYFRCCKWKENLWCTTICGFEMFLLRIKNWSFRFQFPRNLNLKQLIFPHHREIFLFCDSKADITFSVFQFHTKQKYYFADPNRISTSVFLFFSKT